MDQNLKKHKEESWDEVSTTKSIFASVGSTDKPSTSQRLASQQQGGNHYSTFLPSFCGDNQQRNAERQLQEKLRNDRSAEIERDRRAKAAETKKLEKWKANRAAPVVTYLNDDDSDGDDLKIPASAIQLSDSDGGDEMQAGEMLQPKINNVVQVSRLVTGQLEDVNPIRFGAFMNADPKAETSSRRLMAVNKHLQPGKDEASSSRIADKNRKKKRKHKGHDQDSSDSDRDRRRRRSRAGSRDRNESKRSRKRGRNSNSSSSNDRKERKRKRSRDSKLRQKSRRHSSSSSSSTSSDRRKKDAKKPKVKWMFFDMEAGLDIATNAGFNRAIIIAKERNPEIFNHDQVFKAERVAYMVRNCYITLGPISCHTQRQIYERIAKSIYGEKKFNKSKPKRIFDRRIRWSANPENYFATKLDPIDGYIPLSSGRLDKPMTLEEEATANNTKEEISTNQFIAEFEQGKAGDITQKLKGVNERMNTVRSRPNFAQKQAELESLWILKFDLEDADFKHQVIHQRDLGENPMTEQQYLEVKMSKLEAALKELPNSLKIFKQAIVVKKDRTAEDEMNKLFQSKVQTFASDPKFWEMWLDTLLYDMKFYNAKRIDEIFQDAIKKLDGMLRGEYNVPRNLSTDDNKKKAILLLLQKRMEHLVQSGSVAHAVAFTQAVLEHLFMPSHFAEDFVSPDKNKHEAINKSLAEYWDSGAAKIGDEESILWKNYEKGKQYGEPELSKENEELQKLETQTVKVLAAQYSNKETALSKLWVELENLRENYYWRPIRTSGDDFTDEEWARLVRLDDLNLPRVDNERVVLFAIQMPNFLGVRRPFQSFTTSQIASDFGGFTLAARLPERLGDFIDRLCQNLQKISNKMVAWGYVAFQALRIFDSIDNSKSFDRVPGLRKLFMEIRKLTDNQNDPKMIVYSFVLVLQEAKKWFEGEKVDKSVFIKLISMVWLQYLEKYFPYEKSIFNIDDPMIFGFYATLLLTLIKTINNPCFTVWLLGNISNGVFPIYEEDPGREAIKKQINTICNGPKLPSLQVLQALQAWSQRAEFYTNIPTAVELTQLGIYQPATLFTVLFMHFQYQSGRGFSEERFKTPWNNIRDLVEERKLNAWDGAFLYQEVARLIGDHDKSYHNASSTYLNVLSMGTRKFPMDIRLRKMECEANISRPFYHRTQYAERLRSEHQRAILTEQTLLSRILAMARIYFARRVYEHIMLPMETIATAKSTLRLLIKEYRTVATLQKDPFFWCQLIKIFMDRNENGKAYEAYMQGTKTCVWSRELHLYWAKYATPSQIEQTRSLMAQKDVTMLIEDRIVEEYLKINEQGLL